MKLQSSNFLKSSTIFNNHRSRLRWMEWFIAILFIISLLIGSGIFMNASNAANMKIKNHSGLSYRDSAIVPGPMRLIPEPIDLQLSRATVVKMSDDLDSCELKPIE